MLIPVEEYLHTTYRPDCDYVEGEVLERNFGDRDHASAQGQILLYLHQYYPQLRRRLFLELRVQVNAARFRIPDVCVLAEDAPVEQIVRTPPILCIEILSPEDTITRIMVRVKDYFQVGVPLGSPPPGKLAAAVDGMLRAGDIEMLLAEVLESAIT